MTVGSYNCTFSSGLIKSNRTSGRTLCSPDTLLVVQTGVHAALPLGCFYAPLQRASLRPGAHQWAAFTVGSDRFWHAASRFCHVL